MSTSAIVLMIIGCGGLWGGFAVSVTLSFLHDKKASK